MANVFTYVYHFIPIQIIIKTIRIIMFTEEKLKEAAKEWADSCQPCNKNWQFNRHWGSVDRTYYSFLAGCKYIIDNIQNEK